MKKMTSGPWTKIPICPWKRIGLMKIGWKKKMKMYLKMIFG